MKHNVIHHRNLILCWSSINDNNGRHDNTNDIIADKLAHLDFNQLHTALNTAIASENFELAAKIRDLLSLLSGPDNSSSAADWRKLHVPTWLADRAADLGFPIPTEVQRRAAAVIADRCDCVIESATGSGKTLAFLLPALSALSYPPITYPDDLLGPQLIIIVPTRELGVQIVMLVYKLFGGSVNSGFVPGSSANMFRYSGPRGLIVKGLLSREEADMAVKARYLDRAHVVVGTPENISDAMRRGVAVTQHCFLLVVDEADQCFNDQALDMEYILQSTNTQLGPDTSITTPTSYADNQTIEKNEVQENLSGDEEASNTFHTKGATHKSDQERQKPVLLLAGATIDDRLIDHVTDNNWLVDPVLVQVGQRMRLPSSLRHKFILVPDSNSRVGAMCRQIRRDLKQQSQDTAPARVIVFADNGQQARSISDPLRTILWGDHTMSVLLPGGVEPISALHSFRDNKTTLLLATPSAARGLDLPAVSHVYNISPPESAEEYLHRAGRAGRIGSSVNGVITTVVTAEEMVQLQSIADALGLRMKGVEALAPPRLFETENESAIMDEDDVDEAKRALEAMLALSPDNEKKEEDDGGMSSL